MYMPDGKLVPGVQATALLQVGSFKLGLIGVTSDVDGAYEDFFNVSMPPVLPLVQEHAVRLRESGADLVILLSHLGLAVDRELASHLQHDIPLIIGAHSHHLMPEGEWVGDVFIAQAGEYAQHLGRLDLIWDGVQLKVQRVATLTVTEAIPPAPRILDEVGIIEAEAEQYLQGIIGELVEPLDYASDRECGAVNLMADMLRERMHADVAVITAGAAFTGPLPAGPLRRMTLWDVCTSPGNPGVVTMTGTQLLSVVRRGLDPDFAKDCPRPMRGQQRGFIHLSGARIHDGQLLVHDQPVEPGHEYRVAGSDWELEAYGGYVDPAWGLRPHFDAPTILREALEEYLLAHRSIQVEMGRIE
jgi:2',3'-cyclic-nucleotide 2'-phosphodiesterase (5'-nucleotidase family)